MTKIILGTAHLKSTPGKCSPDNRLYEYKYSREIVDAIYTFLTKAGYEVYIDIPEEDLPLTTTEELKKRVLFVNSFKDCIYVSVHVNGAGDGTKWLNATGWECYTTKGKTESDVLAEYLYKSAELNLGIKCLRKDTSDGDSDKESNFYVLKNTNCPAVLTENFFLDNKKDVDFLLSDVGFHKIVKLHVDGIINYIDNK